MPNIVAEIIIQLDDTGNCTVSGAIDNKLIALGLLAIAGDTINERLRQQEKRVQLAPAGLTLVSPGKA